MNNFTLLIMKSGFYSLVKTSSHADFKSVIPGLDGKLPGIGNTYVTYNLIAQCLRASSGAFFLPPI